jgi:hypothetical protein
VSNELFDQWLNHSTYYKRTHLSITSALIIIIIIIIIICKELGVTLDSALWYKNVSKSVETRQVGKVTILWNQHVQTDRTVPNSKPGIIIRHNEKGTCMLIDVPIPGDRNVIKKEAEKILKYKDLTT